MSWLNQSLSGLTGQFKNLANEVFSESIVEDTDPFTELAGANQKIQELQNLCASQDVEIKSLRRQNATLHQDRLNALAAKNNGASGNIPPEVQSTSEEDSSWFWDPPDAETSSSNTPENQDSQGLLLQIQNLQTEISTLKSTKQEPDLSNESTEKLKKELQELREENRTLTLSLEDLDSQNQIAMDKLIKLKSEIQSNYETLQNKYEKLEKENAEFKTRLKENRKEDAMPEMTETNLKLVSDLGTLHQKYENLEKVHRILTENTEKFQEDNVELCEENFRLQEEYTKLQNDLEELQKSSQPLTKCDENLVPNETYKELEDKFLKLEKKFAETSGPKSVNAVSDVIHDTNAQEIIAKLKFEIVELQNKLNTNEEIKRLNLEIDHLKKVVETLSIEKEKRQESIPCEAVRAVIDKYITFDLPGIQKPLQIVPDELLKYTDTCLKTFSEVKSKIETLEIRVAEDSRVINNLQSNIDEMNAEMDILNGDLAHYEHECSELKKNNDFLIAEIGALKSVSKLEPILEHNEEHLEKLQTELEDCSNLNKSFEAELEKNEHELRESVTEKKKLKQEMESLKVSLTNAKEEINRLRAIQSEPIDDSLCPEVLQQRLTNSQNEVDKLKNQLHSVTVDNEKNKIDITILDNDKILLLREISELKANLQTKSIIEDYAKKIEAEKTELEVKLSHLHETETFVETINKENEVLKIRVAKLDALSDNHDKVVNEELEQHKTNALENAKVLTKKETELQEAKSKIVALENSLQEVQSLTNDLECQMNAQYQKLYEVLLNGATMESDKTDLIVESKLDSVVQRFEGVVSRINIELETKNCTNLSLIAELSKHTEELSKVKTSLDQLSDETREKDLTVKRLNSDIEKILNELSEKNTLIDLLNQTVQKLKLEASEKEKFSEIMVNQHRDVESKDLEITKLTENVNNINEELCVVKAQKDQLLIESQEQIAIEMDKVDKLSEILNEKQKETEMKSEQISILNETILQMKEEIEETACKYQKLIEEKNAVIEDQRHEELKLIRVSLDEVQKQKLDLNTQLDALRNEMAARQENLEKQKESCLGSIKELEAFKVDANLQLEQLNVEKNELINLVTQKHHESITYHGEIQRLNAVLFTENERYRELERIYADLRDRKQNDEQANPEEISRLQEALKEKSDKCARLESTLDEIEKSGITPEELEKLGEKNQFLVEKCEVLGKNIVMEQGNTRQIMQEKSQILEREQSLRKELERLRLHLVEMEEEHTKELVAAEQKLQEAQTKLSTAEEKVKHSSTLYTSNSIRANQEVETLRMQIRLVEKQRDDIQVQLSQAEDHNSKNLAALTNLQCVLEQFQMDKERDGEAVAGRARRDLETARTENLHLQQQVADLEEKLRDSSSGLRAASRLSAQLDARAAQLLEAREQASKLEEELNQWKKKYRDAVSNQQDKVDKSLVKNLLMGFIHTTNSQRHTDRIQVLRLLSTVLDFDQSECERAGLGSKSSSGSLGASADSLAQEFVRFLEKESRPQPRVGLPNLLHLGHAQGPHSPGLPAKSDSPTSSTPRAATNSPQRFATSSPATQTTPKPVPIIPLTIANPILTTANLSPITVPSANSSSDSINPVTNPGFNNSLFGGFSLFTPIANPDLVVNQTRNNEGAILKNVLKDT